MVKESICNIYDDRMRIVRDNAIHTAFADKVFLLFTTPTVIRKIDKYMIGYSKNNG